MLESFYVYIAGNERPTLYIGVTNNLVRRTYEHKNGHVERFTKKYNLHKLLYYKQVNNVESAILRKKQLEHRNRSWKLELIKQFNPNFKDMYDNNV